LYRIRYDENVQKYKMMLGRNYCMRIISQLLLCYAGVAPTVAPTVQTSKLLVQRNEKKAPPDDDKNWGQA